MTTLAERVELERKTRWGEDTLVGHYYDDIIMCFWESHCSWRSSNLSLFHTFSETLNFSTHYAGGAVFKNANVRFVQTRHQTDLILPAAGCKVWVISQRADVDISDGSPGYSWQVTGRFKDIAGEAGPEENKHPSVKRKRGPCINTSNWRDINMC